MRFEVKTAKRSFTRCDDACIDSQIGINPRCHVTAIYVSKPNVADSREILRSPAEPQGLLCMRVLVIQGMESDVIHAFYAR